MLYGRKKRCLKFGKLVSSAPYLKKGDKLDYSKLQIYRTLVRPVVTYGPESWTLAMEDERALAVFERKILRKIYGPVKENELWRIRQNDELEAIIK